VQFAAEKEFPESRMLASDTHRFFKSHPEVKHKLADYCNAYPDLFARYKYEGAGIDFPLQIRLKYLNKLDTVFINYRLGPLRRRETRFQ
jgi:hypothetical protein